MPPEPTPLDLLTIAQLVLNFAYLFVGFFIGVAVGAWRSRRGRA